MNWLTCWQSKGASVIGYDPDSDAVARCLQRGGSVEYGGSTMLEQFRADRTQFDAVICSRVLCTIADGDELGTVLTDLRRLVV